MVDAELPWQLVVIGDVEYQQIGALADLEAPPVGVASERAGCVDGGGHDGFLDAHLVAQNGQRDYGLHAKARIPQTMIAGGENRDPLLFEKWPQIYPGTARAQQFRLGAEHGRIA